MSRLAMDPGAPGTHICRGGERHHQHGVTLFVVLVFVLLSMLLALWASRTSLFNELVISNDADYQRAFEAAQALLQDAELDIRGERADGRLCTTPATPAAGAGEEGGLNPGDICRKTTVDAIPLETGEVDALLSTLAAQSTGCRNGLCIKRVGRQDFWNADDDELASHESSFAQLARRGIGARYGQFTGAVVGSDGAPGNPILAYRGTDADRGAWYWIEILPYVDAAGSGLITNAVGGNYLPINAEPHVVYRITAIAAGRKPNTVVVLQETYVDQRSNLDHPS